MQNLALAVEAVMPCQEVDIISTGVESMAVAALLSSRGRGVRFRQDYMSLPEHLLIRGAAVSYRAGRLGGGHNGLTALDSYRSCDLMLVCGKAGDYREALQTVAELLYPGQTVFVVDAPFGTVFELSCLIFKLRKRMAVNILEMGPLFDECKFEAGSLEISGLREQVPICGRSLNETRCGLDVGRQLFSGLVPASNVLERGLSDLARIMRIALRLFHVTRSRAAGSAAAQDDADEQMLDKIEAEIRALGKVYNVHVPARGLLNRRFSENLEREKQDLVRDVCEVLVLLSDLAGVAYLSVPTLDSIIEMASVAFSRDLRASGRKLSNLGLSGMLVRDIIELVNS
jgi:opine dehydrogenase